MSAEYPKAETDPLSIPLTQKGAANGVASTGSDGMVSLANRAIPPTPAFEYKPVEQRISIFDSVGAWTHAGSGTMVADTTDFIFGTQSIKFTTDGVSGSGNPDYATMTFAGTDLSDHNIRVAVKTDNPASLSAIHVYLSNGSGGFTNYVKCSLIESPWIGQSSYVIADGWHIYTLSRGDFVTGAGVTDQAFWAGINTVRIRAVDLGRGAGDITNVWWNLLSAVQRPSKGIITFTADDGHVSQSTVMAPALDKYGWRGTFYKIVERVGATNYMTAAQWASLRDYGYHEIAAHAYAAAIHDAGYTASNAATQAADLISLQRWLTDNADRHWGHFAIPLGLRDGNLNTNMRKYFKSARTIAGRPTGTTAIRETWPPGDPLNLRAWSILSTDTLANVKAAVDKAATNKEWLILTFHYFDTAGANNWLGSDFRSLLDYIKTTYPTQLVVKPMAEALATGSS